MAKSNSVSRKQTTKAVRARRSVTAVHPAAPALYVARVLQGEGTRWELEAAGKRQWVTLDASVDPGLALEAVSSGARALVEAGPAPRVVGFLQTHRTLQVDRQNRVEAAVESFKVKVRGEALLQTESAFVQLKGGRLELYGESVLTRAREVARVLARLVSFN